MTKRNYTLIELLTVIFIIAVLAGLVMPATNMVRGKARRTACSSNLKQVGALAMQFSNDRDGQIPLYKADDSKCYAIQKKPIENALRNKLRFSNISDTNAKKMYTDKKSVFWTHALVRYAKYNMNVFFCPSDERDLNIFEEDKNSSYSLNYGYKKDGTKEYWAPGGKSESSSFIKISDVTRSPGSVIMFGETGKGQLGMDYVSDDSNFFKDYYTDKSAFHRPHSKEFNYSFLDGHVEFLQLVELQKRADMDAFRIAPKQ